MRQRQAAGPVIAGACAVTLAVSLAASGSGHAPAGARSAALPTAAPASTPEAGSTAGLANQGPAVSAAPVPRQELSFPDAVAAAGNDVWVADAGAASGGTDSVAELNAASGAIVRVIPARGHGLDDPDAVAAGGGGVWVANRGANSVTEIDAVTGGLVRVVSGPGYRFSSPDAVAADGNDVWVANPGGSSVTEISAVTGGLIRVVALVPAAYASDGDGVPYSITGDGAGVWVLTNLGIKAVDGASPAGSVAELSAATGRPVRNVAPVLVAGGNTGGSIAADGTRILVANYGLESSRGWVAGFSAATGRLLWVNDS
jgi:hypothetical protein